MRHSQTKPNSSSNKSNVGSGSGAKLVNVSQKGVSNKRISREPVRCSKKRKLNPGESPAKGKSSTAKKHKKESETEKRHKKVVPTVVKKSCVKVKRLKKPNEKFKRVSAKKDKKALNLQKILKKCKVFEKIEDSYGPPTLCETFSRITSMVAETVINERENQKLTENLMGKGKKEADGSGSSKGKDGNASRKGASEATSSSKVKKETSAKKVEANKKVKTISPKSKVSKMKGGDVKKAKVSGKKSNEKPTLDNTENMVKVLKDEEIVLAFGKGIGTRRKSTAGSVENEQKPESSESGKGKTVAKAGKEEPAKKVQKVEKAVKKEKTLVKSKKKTKATEVHTKKSHEEGKKNSEKDKEDHSNTKEQAQKKVKVKKEPPKLKTYPKRKEERSSSSSKRKLPAKEVKSPKPKLGSETDGSNSDELTLNIIQKKTKKTKLENEKTEASGKSVKIEPNQEEVKVKTEDRSSESEKSSSKAKKIKTEKDDKEVVQEKKLAETSKESKKTKETESDTDEDLELKKIVAKKLGRNFKIASEPKKKSSDSGKSGSETEQRARRMRLFGFWSGPKRHRVASLNALAKVHCLYENESKGVMAEIEKMGQIAKPEENKTEKKEEKLAKSDKKVSTSKKSGKDSESEKLDSVVINKRTLRGTPGTRGAGKHWDMFTGDSTSSSASSDESHSDTDRPKDRKLALPPSYRQKMQKKEDLEKDESSKAPKRRRNTEIGLAMDLKDMVVQKRIASLNASAIMSLSYSSEKRSNRKDSSGTSTEDGTSSVEDNERLLSADEGENVNNKTVRKKSSEPEKPPEEKVKENESDSEVIEYKHKKHFWKTKVESLKKLSKEKRNSPSPILAEYGVERDFTTRVFEKEKNDVLHDDKEKDKKGSNKLGYPEPKGKVKGKSSDGKQKNKTGESEKESMVGNDESKSKRKYSKRKMAGEEMKNINIEKMSGDVEKTDEYEYKSDSDNGKRKLIELRNTGGSNKKVAVIVNQDTDVTITGVYVNSTRSTHHEGFCSIAGMQYRISSTSHTQTEATAMLKTSTASEQSPPPTEPTNCSSPRTHKSYTPLSALSNMQPPAGAPSHPHLPPPPHHHHHLCGMGQHRPPPDHYMGHGPISHQRTISPLGRRHGCSSAFSAPHCSSHPGPVGPSSPAQEGDAFGSSLPSHGYFQPAGPLIHHHSSSSGPLKNQNLTSLDSSSTSESQRPGSNNEEPLESTGRTGGENPAPPPPPPSTAHHMGYPRGYPPYQSGYYQGGYYPPPPQSAHYQPPPPPPAFHQHYHHHQDLCYPPGYPPSSYPPPPGSYRRFLQPPSSYYSPELTYGSSGPPPPQDHGAQQMVVPGGPSSSYSGPLDSYPPPAPYYPGYTPGPSPACYSHPPSSRNLAFIEQTYQSCPCPMQLCPKNVHIGPLTGECKRPGTSLPLPPVALHLPQEPPGAAGPPSPARGSAGMPPQPSPVSSTARPNHGPTWDGRPVKSTTEMKWEESKTSLEVKPSTKYKTDTLNYADTKEIWNLSNRKSDFTELEAKSAESVENQWNVSMDRTETKPESFSQGLLAISSKDMLLTARTQLKEANAAPTEHVEDGKIVKSEKGTTFPEVMEPSKSSEQTNHRKCESFEQKPETKINENILTSEEGSKKRKRKAEATTENLESKVKKVKKSESGKRRSEDEKECADGKVSGKSQKSQMVDVKAKLLKDRNETVLKNEERSEEEKETKTDKIIPRRQSIQERASKLCYLVYEVLRKSRSCSPSRSRIREPSPSRLLREDSKRKLETTRKSKPETKTKTIQEHSRPSGKGGRKGSGGTKAKVGKQVTVLTKCSQTNATPSSKSKKAVSILKKSVSKKALTGSPRTIIAPKWSNGWSWDSESFDAKVYLTNDEPPVTRKCYTAMRHVEGDVIHPRDCILLKAGPRRIDLPFVAKVAALWENPDDGEMMVSLLWYYRPEHTDQGRQPSDEQDEIFASRHKDINSVACIEDKCFVLTYNEYCRYRKDVRRVEEGVAEKNSPVPRLEQPYFRVQRQPPCVMAPDMVFFCRRVYDFRQKRLLKNPA